MKGLVLILKQLRPYRYRALFAVFLSVLTVSSHIGLMATSAYLLARAALHPPILDLMVAIVGVRFFGVSRAVFRYFERYFSHDVTFRILGRIRVMVYRSLEPLAPAKLMHWRSGDLLNRIVGDIEIQQNLFLRVLVPPLVAIMVLLGYGLFIARFDVRFSFILAALFLVSGVGIPFLIRGLSMGTGKEWVTKKALLQTQIMDMIQGMPELLAFGQVELFMAKMRQTQEELGVLQRKMAHFSGLANALMGIMMNFGLWSVLVLGVLLVEGNRMNGVYLGMLTLGVLSSFEAVSTLPMAWQTLEETQAAADRIWELMQIKAEMVEVPVHVTEDLSAQSLDSLDNGIRVSGLSFQYKDDEPLILENISFEVQNRGRIGIVGPSGAGKSTIVHLLERFWDYPAGDIFLGGRSLKKYSAEAVRERIGVVSQKTHVFHATIKENLLLAKPSASDDELEAACRHAKIHDFILSLPGGYEHVVGEDGLKLSGGQRQRLAIARVLLKNAPILILDEATSGLDPVTERDVMQDVYELMKGRTTIVISHHLPTVMDLDEIFVLERGKIVERGRHDSLLAQGGLYTRLWESAKLDGA